MSSFLKAFSYSLTLTVITNDFCRYFLCIGIRSAKWKKVHVCEAWEASHAVGACVHTHACTLTCMHAHMHRERDRPTERENWSHTSIRRCGHFSHHWKYLCFDRWLSDDRSRDWIWRAINVVEGKWARCSWCCLLCKRMAHANTPLILGRADSNCFKNEKDLPVRYTFH